MTSAGPCLEYKANFTRSSIITRGTNIRIIGGGGRGGSISGRTKIAMVSTTMNMVDLNPKSLSINANEMLIMTLLL